MLIDAITLNSRPSKPSLRTPWTSDDYGLDYAIRGGGAAKLADSGVAPLVAQARGYEVVTSGEEAKAVAVRQRSNLSALQAKRSIEKHLHGGLDDVLVMPWYSPETVVADGVSARVAFSQFRPSTPEVRADGKKAKYVTLPGTDLSLDVHPATPMPWLDGDAALLLTEGLLKGDSALSAQLLQGVGAEDLVIVESADAAREKLSELMARIPASLRVLVVNSVSVTTWRRDAGWRSLNLRGRKGIVAFDGDVASNAMVWRETEKALDYLSARTNRPSVLLGLHDASVAAAALASGFDPEQKVGIDEYLTRIGDFYPAFDYLGTPGSLLTETLPPAPAPHEEHAVGDWRIHPDCPAIVQELVASVLPDGARGIPTWITRSHVGLELLEIRSTRLPEEEELRSGRILDTTDAPSNEEVVAKFHVLPHDGDAEFDVVEVFDVRMPASALAASRDGDWSALIRSGAMRLPARVLAHPHFPPRDMKAWLSAAKAGSSIEQTHGWATMGWVPTGSGLAFVTGTQVVGRSPEEEASTTPGLTASVLPRYAAWGVEDSYRTGAHYEWEKAVVDDVERAVTTWMSAFKAPGIAAISLAMMLRPTIPLRGQGTVCVVTGRAGSGKSFLASLILKGWEAYSGAWTHSALPGTAADTIPSTELALSQTPLHVLDDLAPNSDAGRGASRQSSVEDLVRSVFNGTPRRRMGENPVPAARAHLIVTAENLSGIESIRQRTWELDLSDGLLVDGGREQLEAAAADGTFTRLVGHAIRGWVSGGLAQYGWLATLANAQELYDQAADDVRDRAVILLGREELSREARQLEKASNLLAPVLALADTVAYAMAAQGNDPAAALDVLTETIPALLVGHALAAAKLHAGRTPGRLALTAIGALLASGRAHLQNPCLPTATPFASDADNVAAGWQIRGGNWIPGGPAVGVAGVTAKGDKVAVLSATAAFSEAAKAFPGLVPSGSTARAAWASLEGDDELVPVGAAPQQQRLRADAPGAGDENTSSRARGVVVSWDGLLGLAD
ncbi:hypothetical protein [Microbacterium sp. Cr-K29]|uniref:hypothetical protein n=1 Tax=Microbacterium sp. Cr-K29 TaxID=1452534 RepID=UPI000493307B|nr:hypothetical protein [Microbacterium sp. Cr-K29]